ncbi:MAG: hypothetical protein WC330_06115 [Candidatus Omnitrophota bacterium]|jgi:hypothetical protein
MNSKGKKIFTISGRILDENKNGLESLINFDGYQGNPVYETKKDGYFKFEIEGIRFYDFFSKHFLLVFVKSGSMEYASGGILFNFRIFPDKSLTVNLFPFSKKVEIIKGNSRIIRDSDKSFPLF